MADNSSFVADQYDRISQDYEAWYTLDWPEPVYRQGTAIKDILISQGLPHSLDILDLTCGIGTQSLGLAIHGHRMTSIDISSGQISKARQSEKEFPIPHPVKWIVGNAVSPTQCVSGKFDAIISFGSSLPLLGSEDAIRQSMEESFSLLKEGGLLLVSMVDHTVIRKDKPYILNSGTLNHNGKQGAYLETASWLEDGKRYQSNIVFVWTHPESYHAHYPFPPLAAITRTEYMEILTGIGFINVVFEQPSGLSYPVYIARKP